MTSVTVCHYIDVTLQQLEYLISGYWFNTTLKKRRMSLTPINYFLLTIVLTIMIDVCDYRSILTFIQSRFLHNNAINLILASLVSLLSRLSELFIFSVIPGVHRKILEERLYVWVPHICTHSPTHNV